MILTAICLFAAGLCYYLGLTDPGPRGRGTVGRWAICLGIGALLALIFYSFSAFGLIVSIDNLFSDF